MRQYTPANPTGFSHARSRQAQLQIGHHNQPTPVVGLLGVPDPWGSPSQSPLEKVEGVLQVEPVNVGFPEKVEVWFSGAMPPQPQLLQLAALLTFR